MLKLSLCDYNYAYILAVKTISVANMATVTEAQTMQIKK